MLAEIYQLKITLVHSKPPIWRRLLVPADFRLRELHSVIQAVMEWQHSHLYEFQISNETFGDPTFADPFGGPDLTDDAKIRLRGVLDHVGAKATYTYDFGDNWDHSIVVEKILPAEPGAVYPVCTAGKRRGPPEDCGGIFGYYDLLAVIHDPAHEDYEQMVEWAGGPIDAEDFSLADMNRRLASFCKKPKRTPRSAKLN